MAIRKNNRTIADLDTWRELGGHKREDQWVIGRSAMEIARYWLAVGSDFPDAIAQPLAAHPSFGSVVDWNGEPEARLSFDRRGGEPRNCDLLIECVDERGRFILAIEAKADETFGETVAEALVASLERRLENDRSGALARIQDLAGALLGRPERNLPGIGELRYQLLTAFGGALAEGVRRRVDRVIVHIQEFRTSKTLDEKHRRNATDLEAFIKRLSRKRHVSILPDTLIGPFRVPGRPLFDAVPDLFVLKTIHDLRPDSRH